MFSYTLENGSLPQTLNEAVITLIPQKGKDPKEVGGYRPVSLLNMDQNILVKVLANRVNKNIGNLVHTDQTGFIPGRNPSSDLRCLFNIMYHPQAEKVFNQVECSYLFAVLDRFNLGDKFTAWIKLLYNNPKAQILTNGMLSPYFNLFRDTRQACLAPPVCAGY